jgi:hypothetical protein
MSHHRLLRHFDAFATVTWFMCGSRPNEADWPTYQRLRTWYMAFCAKELQ